jgi:hypothetical protein
MQKNISLKIIENEKLLNHLKENSYWIKHLNRHPNYLKEFEKNMKELYKERPTDKINSFIDNIDMISSIIDTIK